LIDSLRSFAVHNVPKHVTFHERPSDFPHEMLIAMAAEITWALAACDAGDHYLYPKHLVSTSDFYIPENEER
jgi:hypothetical protein